MIQKINFDIKFHQKQGKSSFSIIFINFHIIYDPKRSKNGLKRSKMIKFGQISSKIIKFCDNVIQKNKFLISNFIKNKGNRVFQYFSSIFTSFIIQNNPKTVWNNLQWSNLVKYYQKSSNYMIMWFKKYIFGIKCIRKHKKLSFSMVLIDFNIIYDSK